MGGTRARPKHILTGPNGPNGLHARIIRYTTGFTATLEIRENLENEFPIFQSGKTQGIWEKNTRTQGKLREFVTVTQEGKVFDSLVYVRLVPYLSKFCSFTDWLYWLL